MEKETDSRNEDTDQTASQADYSAVYFTLEPVEHPDGAGPVEINFGFAIKEEFCGRCNCCEEIPVEVVTTGGLEYEGSKSWTAYPTHDSTHSFMTTVTITLQPNDTSSIRFNLSMNGAKPATLRYFVTTADSVEIWKGPPSKSFWDQSRPKPDTNRYEVKIDLRRVEHFNIIKQFEDSVGPIRPSSDSGFYIIQVTREQFDDLKRDGFKCKYLKEPPPRKSGRPGGGTFKRIGPEPDSSRDRRNLKSGVGEIWLDCVDGEDDLGRLYSNSLIRFILGFANHYGDDIYGITNGVRVYSPDGATWGSTYWDTLGTLAWQECFDLSFSVTGKSITGSGADSIKFIGITQFGNGLPSNFDDTAITIMIGPIPPEDAGKTICFDSSYVSGTSNWYWSSSDGYTLYEPTWYCPACFEITAPGLIYFWGQLRYMDPNPPYYLTYKPIRGTKIYMWDADFGEDDFLDSTITDNSGFFGFGPIVKDHWWDNPDVYFTFYAMNEAAIVCDTFDNGIVYKRFSDTLDDVQPGEYTINDDLTYLESKAFFVADIVLDSYKTWKQVRPSPFDHPWDTVVVQVNKGSSVSHYNRAYDYIYINDSVDFDNRWRDTWDRSVIFHEHGHRLANMLAFSTQGKAQHTVYDLTDLGTAFSEG